MEIQAIKKLPHNLRIIQTDIKGEPLQMKAFVAMLNPESFSIHENIEWCTAQPKQKSSADPGFINIKPRTFSIEFVLDGTGVTTNGVKIPVTDQISVFRDVTTKVRGTIHRPPYLIVQYGTFISTCILESSEVTYTMFDMFGLPIRAKISARFVERILASLSDTLDRLSSPDMTHRVVVKEGDLLPLLTYKIYNNQNYYLHVARYNKLKNFRKLKAGATLIFPPVSKQ